MARALVKTAAILGCTHIHVRDFSAVLAAHPAFETVAVWDPNPETARPWAEAAGLTPCLTMGAVPAVDIAVISGDTRDHTAILLAMLGRARAFYVEKPLGISAQDGAALATLLTESGVPVAMDYFMRAVPAIRRMRALLQDGTIGPLRHMTLAYQHPGLTTGGLAPWPLHGDRARIGHGGFGDLAVHLLDVAEWMAGPVEAVACAVEPDGQGSDVQGHALLRGANGCLITVRAGTVLWGPRVELRLDGTAGSLHLRENSLLLYRPDLPPEVLATDIEARCPVGLHSFLDQLAGGADAGLAGPADAARVDALLERLHRLAGF
jgi:predicted dehydrogenase